DAERTPPLPCSSWWRPRSRSWGRVFPFFHIVNRNGQHIPLTCSWPDPVAVGALAACGTMRFIRAYRRAREWVNTAPATEIARAEQALFPAIAPQALTQTIAYYQRLGCWNPPVAIARETYEVALDVFLHAKLIPQRHPYEQGVVPPPEG